MKVLVTGATGYVGRPLVHRLLGDGHEVIALVRRSERARDLVERGARLVVADLRSAPPALSQPVDGVVHLAFSLFPHCDRTTNVEGSEHLIDASRVLEPRRFVYVSSALVYGPSDPDVLVDETHPARPNLRFARHQLAVERTLAGHARDGLPAVILRPNEVFGGDGGVFGRMVEMLAHGRLPVVGDGTQRIAFTELEDLLEAVVRSLETDLPPGTTMNIGTPVTVPAGALFDEIARRLGGPRPRRIPVPVVLAYGLLAEAAARLTKPLAFDLDLARLGYFRCGPRSIEKARRLIGFAPAHPDPTEAIAAHYLRDSARARRPV